MDPAEEFPNLIASRLNPKIFEPYVKAGRFTSNEPEDLAKAFINVRNWAAGGIWAGLPLAFLTLRWRAKRTRSRPSLLLSIIAYPLSSFICFQAGYNIAGAVAASNWGSANPHLTPSQVIDKVTLYNQVAIYARDPNATRPPLHVDPESAVGRALGQMDGPIGGEGALKRGEERIKQEFLKGSPLRNLGGEGKGV